MFAYALLRLDRLGLSTWVASGRPATGSTPLRRGSSGAGPDGTAARRCRQVCHVAGLGGFEVATATARPPITSTEVVVRDDVKGVGPLLMAAGERVLADRAMPAATDGRRALR